MPAAIMVQGTGSNVGKSLIVAGLCRLFRDRGLTVRPFKPQNMSNNAAATMDGGEIGRAQALQAKAAGVAPSVHMNPILLKPETDTGAQVIVQGQRAGTMRAREYGRRKAEFLPAVMESFARTSAAADVVIVEGAGSPAEVNLRAGDIANMGFAEAADVPVMLVGDIDRGGVIASLVGCHAVLPEAERTRIRGFLINRFRGDTSLFADGMTTIVERTGWAPLGIVPFFAGADRLPAEDSADLDSRLDAAGARASTIRIGVPRLPRIANFDDLDPLRLEPDVDVTFIAPGSALPGDLDLVLLPGSKATIADLAALKAEGWDIDIRAHVRRGGAVLGLCGGYQMLGQAIADPEGIEGASGTAEGLGLLDVATVLTGEKTVRPVEGRTDSGGLAVAGYEIHMGETDGADRARPLFRIDGAAEGAQSMSGRVQGTYLHGVFTGDSFRADFLSGLRSGRRQAANYDVTVEATLDELAQHLAEHVDLEALADIAGLRL
ncbi:MAG: cobyric acid synthase [Pseudomonadota bacterium]